MSSQDEPTLRDTCPPWAAALEDRINARIDSLAAYCAKIVGSSEEKLLKHVGEQAEQTRDNSTALAGRIAKVVDNALEHSAKLDELASKIEAVQARVVLSQQNGSSPGGE